MKSGQRSDGRKRVVAETATRTVLPVPKHIAAIMDGNGRWAEARGLPRAIGHRECLRTLLDIVMACSELGIGWLTVFFFSTENWQRPQAEVDELMRLIADWCRAEQAGLVRGNVRVRAIGRLGDLPQATRGALEATIAATGHCTGLNFTIAISYGGRAEIFDACRRAVEAGRAPVNEDEFRQLLYAPEIPDPDLVIRTGKERRISNYLLWQMACAELYFADTFWPDFNRCELEAVINRYVRRKSRDETV